MVAIADIPQGRSGAGRVNEAAPRRAAVETTSWGYVISGKNSRDGFGPVARFLMGFFGVSLILASAGLWLAPGANFSADVLPMKLACTGLFMFIGSILFQLSYVRARPEVQVDTNRREIRLVSRDRSGEVVLKQIVKFAEIKDIVVSGGVLNVMSHAHLPMMSVSLANHSCDHRDYRLM